MKPQYLIIPENRWKDIKSLLSLSAIQIGAVAETLRSKETLKTEELSYQRVAKKAGITQADAIAVLSAITNLMFQRQRYSLSDEQLLSDLEFALPDMVKSLDPDVKDALLKLLSESEEGYFVQKAESLKIGFAPHLGSVRSICDVRPVFDKNRENIEGALLVTFLGITTHDEEHKDQTFVLQLTRADLRKLQECLQEAERKLSVMEKEFGTKFDLFS